MLAVPLYGNHSNYGLAEKYLKMAVEYDHLDSAYSLGIMYGLLGKEELAYVYLTAAAQLGQEDAIEFLEEYEGWRNKNFK